MAGCKPVLKIEGATAPQIHSYAIFQRARHSHPDIFNFSQKGPTLVLNFYEYIKPVNHANFFDYHHLE